MPAPDAPANEGTDKSFAVWQPTDGESYEDSTLIKALDEECAAEIMLKKIHESDYLKEDDYRIFAVCRVNEKHRTKLFRVVVRFSVQFNAEELT